MTPPTSPGRRSASRADSPCTDKLRWPFFRRPCLSARKRWVKWNQWGHKFGLLPPPPGGGGVGRGGDDLLSCMPPPSPPPASRAGDAGGPLLAPPPERLRCICTLNQ